MAATANVVFPFPGLSACRDVIEVMIVFPCESKVRFVFYKTDRGKANILNVPGLHRPYREALHHSGPRGSLLLASSGDGDGYIRLVALVRMKECQPLAASLA